MTRTITVLSIAFGLFALGCSSSTQNADDSLANGRGTGSDQGGRGDTSGGEDLAARNCQVTSVHFGYDSMELDGQARETLATDAACINRRGGNATVTGMADPRGTEEYNLALGDRRARAVTGYLANLGVSQSQMSARSVGEEYATGENESGWANDRRAQIDLR